MNNYSENNLIEQPTIALFSELGWETTNCFCETFSESRNVPPGRLYMGRETSAEVVLIPRKRMVNENMDKKFKDPDDLFRIVFVCAMWMTGCDVPCCSTIYLDKPMRNHTLMQTTARANRVFRDKLNGLIVDYIGVFRDLQKALSIYGSAAGGGIKEGFSFLGLAGI